ncbi:MAG TPA: DnaD domain protein [Dehalococcoidia bacterium]|nr:DnaD domain protein [Dehalococcoidia bacterium]
MGRGAGLSGGRQPEGRHNTFDGFKAGSLATAVPNAFFARILPQVESIEELVVSLYLFFRLRGRQGPIAEAELRADPGLLRSLANLSKLPPGEALSKGLREAVSRGTLLAVPQGEGSRAYAVNTAANRKILAAVVVSSDDIEELAPLEAVGESNIFRLYEENIGGITPLIADELREAEERYPAVWIEAAFREAVSLNKRSWRYIAAILERWQREGPDYETSGRNTEPDWLEQRRQLYLAGKRRRSPGQQ